jgi:hypothetical protein
MFTLGSRKFVRSAALVIAGGGALLIMSASPAMALCKYGAPHCVDPHRPAISLQTDRGPTIDGTGNGWEDPDCRYYGNCLSSNHDDGCWYVNGVCQPNPQPPPPPRDRPTADAQTRAPATLQALRSW